MDVKCNLRKTNNNIMDKKSCNTDMNAEERTHITARSQEPTLNSSRNGFVQQYICCCFGRKSRTRSSEDRDYQEKSTSMYQTSKYSAEKKLDKNELSVLTNQEHQGDNPDNAPSAKRELKLPQIKIDVPVESTQVEKQQHSVCIHTEQTNSKSIGVSSKPAATQDPLKTDSKIQWKLKDISSGGDEGRSSGQNPIPSSSSSDDNSSVPSGDSDYDRQSQLLPSLSKTNSSKKCCVLDLDETLVHSSFKFVNNADIVVSVEIDGLYHDVYVCKRPYVDLFLQEIGPLFECVLFTASLAKYADPVSDELDPDKVMTHRLFREACVYHEGNFVKDLSRLGRDVDQVFILDNSPVSYMFQLKHAIQCISWFDDPEDTALLDLIPYFKELAASPMSVPDFLHSHKIQQSVGLLGFPHSNLHWVLMQTLSVTEALEQVAIAAEASQEASRKSSAVSGPTSQQQQVLISSASANANITPPGPSLLITQVTSYKRRQSRAAQVDVDCRPPVASPTPRPSVSELPIDFDALEATAEAAGLHLTVGSILTDTSSNTSDPPDISLAEALQDK